MYTCEDCKHPHLMHYDTRGCHVQNCWCLKFYKNIYSEKTEKEVRYNPSRFLSELWDEIKNWHGDIRC